MTQGLPTNHFFQLAYVTRDFDGALKLFASKFGVPEFYRLNLADFAPPGMKLPQMLVGLAYRGDTMIELIQPDPAMPGIYGDAVPSGHGVALHHLGYIVDDPEQWTALPQTFEREGYSIAMRSPPGAAMGFAYIDARKDLGHYLEFCQPSAMRDQLSAKLPRF